MRFNPKPALNRPARGLRALFFAGASAAALLLGIAGADAAPAANQPAANQTDNNSNGQNVTTQVQNEISIALPSLAPLVDRVSPAVVTISAHMTADAATSDLSAGGDGSSDSGSPLDGLMRRFLENRGVPQPGRDIVALGSGFIIDPSGYIATNNHVVGTADTVSVVLHDNSRHSGKIVGRDEKTDLALVKIEADRPLPFVGWGDSNQVKVGDWIVAVGNPFGLGGTVTAGIVSALSRNLNDGPYDDYLQIDAPINRGNSGGPAFDLHGRVIGINTAIYSPSGGSVGIGFAIPANAAKPIVEQLKDNGRVIRGWLGVAIQTITPTIAKSLGLDPNAPTGALVASVSSDSPAARAGLKPGDVILSVNGKPIKSVHDLPRTVAAAPIGQPLKMALRRNGKETTVEATVTEMRERQQVAATSPLPKKEDGDIASGLGIEVTAIDPALRSRFRIPQEVEGVIVTRVAPESPFAQFDIEVGDVIVSVDQRPVKTPAEAADQLKQAAAKNDVLLLLNRRGANQFVGLSVGASTGSSRPPRGSLTR